MPAQADTGNSPGTSCSVVGNWNWMGMYDNSFFQDNTCKSYFKSNGKENTYGVWVQTGNKIKIIWGQGEFFDELTFSSDCNSLDGKNQNDDPVWATRSNYQFSNTYQDQESIESVPKNEESNLDISSNHYSIPQNSYETELAQANYELTQDPTNAYAWENKAGYLANSGSIEEALDAYDTAMSLGVPSNGFNNNAGRSKGDLLSKLGRYEEALDAYNYQINNLGAKGCIVWAYKALVLCKLGRYDEAKGALKQQLELNQFADNTMQGILDSLDGFAEGLELTSEEMAQLKNAINDDSDSDFTNTPSSYPSDSNINVDGGPDTYDNWGSDNQNDGSGSDNSAITCETCCKWLDLGTQDATYEDMWNANQDFCIHCDKCAQYGIYD